MNPEHAILSLVISGNEPGALAYLSQFGVKADWFLDPANRLIYTVAESMQAEGKPIEPVSLAYELRRLGMSEQAGGSAKMSAICDSFTIMGHAGHYIQLLREGRTRRELASLGAYLQTAIANPEERTISEIVAEASEKLTDIASNRSAIKTVGEVARESVERWEAMHRGEHVSQGFDTGIECLDESGRILEPGKLIVVAARPSGGKTTLEGQIARHAALWEGKTVFRITRDTTMQGLIERDLNAMTPGMTLHQAKTRGLRDEQFQRLREAAKELGAGKVWIDDRVRNLEAMMIQCRMMAARHDLGLITVDYAQLVEVANMSGRAKDDERMVISRVTAGFKALAIELGVPVLMLAQLSRGAEENDKERPKMRDLKGSGSLEQDADVVIFLYRSTTFQYGVPYYAPIVNPDGSWVMDFKNGAYTPRMDTRTQHVLQYHDPRRPIMLDKQKHKDNAQGCWPVWLDAGYFKFSKAWDYHGQAHLNQNQGAR